MTTAPLASDPRPFAHLTTPLLYVRDLPWCPEPSLPLLSEPAHLPTAPLPGTSERNDIDPLVPIMGAADQPDAAARIRDLAAYSAVGIPDAPRVSLARRSVVQRLRTAADLLPDGYGLAVFDAWRPLSVQQHLFEQAYADPSLPPGFVTPPSADPATPPPHLTGGTLDLTLTWHGQPLGLGTDFDDFTDAAHTAAFETRPGPVRDHRRLLFWAMHTVGFVVIDCEWWHYEYGTRRWAALTGRDTIFGAVEDH